MQLAFAENYIKQEVAAIEQTIIIAAENKIFFSAINRLFFDLF